MNARSLLAPLLFALAAGAVVTIESDAVADPPAGATISQFLAKPEVNRVANTAAQKAGKRLLPTGGGAGNNDAPTVISVATQPSTTKLELRNAYRVTFNVWPEARATFKSGGSGFTRPTVAVTVPYAANKLIVADCPLSNTSATAKYSVTQTANGGAGSAFVNTTNTNPVTFFSASTAGTVRFEISADNPTETEWTFVECRITTFDYQ